MIQLHGLLTVELLVEAIEMSFFYNDSNRWRRGREVVVDDSITR